ncbi:MAG: NAD-dependent epimerase [Desulfobacterales bacterium]|nr:NAD-dependent epimerase [Desulfobacterales bacterium]
MTQEKFKFKKILVTGASGFIGFHLSKKLLDLGYEVYGIDNMSKYYDVELKQNRLNILLSNQNFHFFLTDLTDRDALKKIFDNYRDLDIVINLAAQPGVRYSLENPYAYVDSNLVGFINLLECCRFSNIKHFVFASSSSVYGANTKMPFSTSHNVDHPVSLYAATKKANELMAHVYSHLYGMACTGLRFFTVYGPWGRPDMAPFIFTKAITEGKPIKVFNHGKMKRDFTYIDDVVEGVIKTMLKTPEASQYWNSDNPDPSTSYVKYKIYNIGNNKPVELMHFIKIIEKKLSKSAILELVDIQPGDVVCTYADITDTEKNIGFKPYTSIEQGMEKFIDWYKDYFKI